MSKVLISFVGTGSRHGDRESREYKKALYKFENGQEEESEFVAKALQKFVRPDKIFLIGTAHSMWEKVYQTFAGDTNIDDDKWFEIDEWCQKAGHETKPDEFNEKYKPIIENAMGNGSKVFLIRYGLNEQEIDENINVIIGLRKFLNNGDEIYVDITHSFRSLPMLIMQLLLYLKQIHSPEVKVAKVFYGMLDISRELHYTPIVDISRIIALNDWISGAYAFKLTGSADKICSLIEKDDKSMSQTLRKFSNLLSLNALGQLQSQEQVLSGLKLDKVSELETLAIKPTVDEFVKTFKKARTASRFQYELARWQFNKMNYLASYTTLVECIVTKACESQRLPWDNFETRNIVRAGLNKKDAKATANILETYKNINRFRNNLVHQNGGNTKASAGQMIKVLEKAIRDLDKEIE